MGDIDLSGWKVLLENNLLGWSWSAEHKNGRTAGPLPISISYAQKENAEKAAIHELEAIERGERYEEIDAEDLRYRLRIPKPRSGEAPEQ